MTLPIACCQESLMSRMRLSPVKSTSAEQPDGRQRPHVVAGSPEHKIADEGGYEKGDGERNQHRMDRMARNTGRAHRISGLHDCLLCILQLQSHLFG
jgi:hypothetical protein